jgi:hypothetical protein
MDKIKLLDKLREVVKALPEVEQHLSAEALEAIKGKADYIDQLKSLVEKLYNYRITADEFTERFADVVKKYLKEAYQSAWQDNGDGGQMPAYLRESYENALGQQLGYIEGYRRDIIIGREDGSHLYSLLIRAELWGTKYNEERNKAIALIAATLLTLGGASVVAEAASAVAGVASALGATEAGGQVIELEEVNMVWREGDTMDKCVVCVALDGIVAPVSVWRSLGVQPQAAPNDKLDCGGWRCQCVLEITTAQADEDAADRIRSAIALRGL